MSENFFNFEFQNKKNHLVRTVQKDDGSIWFVAKEVCEIIGIKWKGSDTTGPLDDDEKNYCKLMSKKGLQNTTIVSESGLYALVFKSRKKQAKVFRKWVTSEVLPTIRKHGVYIPASNNVEKQELSVSDEKQVLEMFISLNDVFWAAHKAKSEHSAAVSSLNQVIKKASIAIRGLKEKFPDIYKGFDMMPATVKK